MALRSWAINDVHLVINHQEDGLREGLCRVIEAILRIELVIQETRVLAFRFTCRPAIADQRTYSRKYCDTVTLPDCYQRIESTSHLPKGSQNRLGTSRSKLSSRQAQRSAPRHHSKQALGRANPNYDFQIHINLPHSSATSELSTQSPPTACCTSNLASAVTSPSTNVRFFPLNALKSSHHVSQCTPHARTVQKKLPCPDPMMMCTVCDPQPCALGSMLACQCSSRDAEDIATTSLILRENTNFGGRDALRFSLVTSVAFGFFRCAAGSCGLDERSKVDEGFGGLHERVLYLG